MIKYFFGIIFFCISCFNFIQYYDYKNSSISDSQIFYTFKREKINIGGKSNYKYVFLSYSDSTRNEHISISELKFLDGSRFYWSGFSIDEELNLLKNSTDTFSLIMTDSGINLMLKSDTILLLPNQSTNDFKFSYYDFCIEHYLQTDKYNRIEIKRMPDTTINYNGKDEIILHYKTKSAVHLKHYEEDLLILKKNLLPFKLHRKYYSDPTPMHYGYDNNEVLLFWN